MAQYQNWFTFGTKDEYKPFSSLNQSQLKKEEEANRTYEHESGNSMYYERLPRI